MNRLAGYIRICFLVLVLLSSCQRDADRLIDGLYIQQLEILSTESLLFENDKHTFGVKMYPEDGVYYDLEWNSSDPEILQLDNSGRAVAGIKRGAVVVEVRDRNSGLSSNLTINVGTLDGHTIKDGTLVVGTAAPGQLAGYLEKVEGDYQGLILLGLYNGSDIQALRNLDKALPKGLNLKNVDIVAGGDNISGSYAGKSYSYAVSNNTIGPYMFCRESLTNPELVSGLLQLPRTVTLVDSFAFAGTDVQRVQLTQMQERIAKDAFLRCENLKGIDFREAVSLKYLGGFAETTALEKLDSLPLSLLEITDYAFYKSNLKTLSLVINVEDNTNQFKKIGKYAFAFTQQIASETFIPFALEEIDDHAFESSSIRRVALTNMVLKRIGKAAFKNTLSLRTMHTWQGGGWAFGPPGMVVDDYAFENSAIDLNSGGWNFADRIQKIGKGAFQNCKNIRSVISKRIDDIGEQAFKDCTNLEFFALEVFYPVDFMPPVWYQYLLVNEEGANRPVSIARQAFENCTNLKRVQIHMRRPPQLADVAVFSNLSPEAKLEIPTDYKAIYENWAAQGYWKHILAPGDILIFDSTG